LVRETETGENNTHNDFELLKIIDDGGETLTCEIRLYDVNKWHVYKREDNCLQ